MSIEIETMTNAQIEVMRSIVRHPSLAQEFDTLTAPGALEDALNDPFGSPEWRWLGWVDGQPGGMASAFVLPARTGAFAVIRLGVIEPMRRRGLGRALLQRAFDALRRSAPHCREFCISGYVPNAPTEAFAASVGYAHARYFWVMERPRGPVAPIEWPVGIETRTFDGSDRALTDWRDIVNDSFAEHWHSVVATLEEGRTLAAQSSFDPNGLLLAYRDGRCVGHCRNEVHGDRGEVAVIGTSRHARGIGLGRALLRWGVAWLQQHDVTVTLFVDGENENALKLYRSEGFEKKRTRQIWARKLES